MRLKYVGAAGAAPLISEAYRVMAWRFSVHPGSAPTGGGGGIAEPLGVIGGAMVFLAGEATAEIRSADVCEPAGAVFAEGGSSTWLAFGPIEALLGRATAGGSSPAA